MRGRCLPDQSQSIFKRCVRVRDQRLLSALPADLADQLPGVRTGDARDPQRRHGLGQRRAAAEVGGPVVVVPDDHAADAGPQGLEVVVVDPVIADQRVGHDHELVGVGGVREDLLVAHGRRVEDQLADPAARVGPKGQPGVYTAVRQNQLSGFCIINHEYFSFLGDLRTVPRLPSNRSFLGSAGIFVG